jgi:hypothetical protein
MIPGPDKVIACPNCSGLGKYRTALSWNTIGARYRSDGFVNARMLIFVSNILVCIHCEVVFWLTDAHEVGEVDPIRPANDTPTTWCNAPYLKEPDAEGCFAALERGLARDRGEEKEVRILAWHQSNDEILESARRTISPLAGASIAISAFSLLFWLDSALAQWTDHQSLNSVGIAVVITTFGLMVGVLAWLIPPRGQLFLEEKQDRTSFVRQRTENMQALLPLLSPTSAYDDLMKAELLRELGRFDDSLKVLNSIEDDELKPVVEQLIYFCDERDSRPQYLD